MRIMIILCSLFFFSKLEAAQTAYVNFNWVNPTQKKVFSDSLLITEHGKITYIGEKKALPKEINVIDLHNKYVLPGFIDAHTHVTLGAISFEVLEGEVKLKANNSDEIAEHNGRVLLAHGITDIRNPGGDTQKSVHYKTQVSNGHWLGPDAYVAGELLDQALFEGLSVAVSSRDEIDKVIAQQKDMGVDLIKLYTGLDDHLLKQAIDISHQYGLKTVAHLDQIVWDDASQMGLDAVVHAMPISTALLSEEAREKYKSGARPGTFAFFEWYEAIDFESDRFKKFLKNIAHNKLHVDPTLIAFYNAFWGNDSKVIEHPLLHLTHPELVNNWRTFFTFNVGWQTDDFRRAQAVWPKIQTFIRLLHQHGVMMTVGTDMNNPWVIPGVSFHQEMDLLVKSGLPIYDVLMMATLNGAIAIDQQNTKGSLAPGKLANFVVLNKDPSTDISHTKSLHAVVKKGQWYEPEQLLQAVEK